MPPCSESESDRKKIHDLDLGIRLIKALHLLLSRCEETAHALGP
jgi:hypothetical protein